MSGKLSVVATPIGNLEDITLRALRVLKEADFVACENVTHTRKLLSHFDIHTPALVDRKALPLLRAGKHVALVSDAGTPVISDPGGELVARVREEGIAIEVVPGASSLSAALSVAGLKAPSFVFYGFLPQKKGREGLLREIAGSARAGVFFESTHRILKALESLAQYMPERRLGLFRELTKLHEEELIGTPEALMELLKVDPQKQKGEFVVIVEGR